MKQLGEHVQQGAAWIWNAINGVGTEMGGTWVTAIGTIVLAIATVNLVFVTKGLREETKKSREEQRWWQEKDGYIRGIEPFLGAYVERGKAWHPEEAIFVGEEGALLDVNWYGVAFRDRHLGTYVGGHVEVTENGLEFLVGGGTGNEGNGELRIRLTKGQRRKTKQVMMALGAKLEPEPQDYRLVVETTGPNAFTVRDTGVDKAETGGWKRGRMVNESYVPSPKDWWQYGTANIVSDGKKREPRITLGGAAVVKRPNGGWTWISKVVNAGEAPGEIELTLKDGERIISRARGKVDALSPRRESSWTPRNGKSQIEGLAKEEAIEAGMNLEVCIEKGGEGCLKIMGVESNPQEIEIAEATLQVYRGRENRDGGIVAKVRVRNNGDFETGEIYVAASRTNGSMVCMLGQGINLGPEEEIELYCITETVDRWSVRADNRVEVGTTVDIAAYGIGRTHVTGGEILWGKWLTTNVRFADKIPLQWLKATGEQRKREEERARQRMAGEGRGT